MSTRTRRLTFFLVAALGVAALVAGFAARGPFERKQFVDRLERETDAVVDVDRFERSGDGYVVEGLHAHSRGGAFAVDAPHARIVENDPNVRIVLEGARVTVAPERIRGDEFVPARSDAMPGDATLAFRDATFTVVRGLVPEPVIAFDRLVGDATLARANARLAARADLIDGAERYPVTVGRDPSVGDAATWTFDAPVLPVRALAALFGTGGGLPPSGFLRDVDVRDGSTSGASFRLDDVTFALGAHVLARLHGNVTGRGDGVGTRSIAGVLDAGVPFEAAGEVHDLGPHDAWLRDGSNDLRALARLIDDVGNEPRLRSVRVEATAPGLAFGQYGIATDHGPLAISVLSIDPHEPTLRFDTALAEDHVVSGGERTSAMGLRTGAVAGVNGDYFDIGRTYQPQGMLVRNGTLLRGPTDRAALAIDRDKNVVFSEFRMHGAVRTARGTMPITEFNDWPPGFVSVITPDYGRTLRGVGDATFVGLEPEGYGKRFRVTSVVAPGGAPDVSFGIAIGSRVRVPIPKMGETVELSYDMEPALGRAVAAIGGGPILLRDGAWYEDPHAPAPDERNYRWPVVALARRSDARLMLVAVDGRHPERSVGATRPEFATILQRLGARDAMALDSGGSVTLISRAPGDANVSVRNVPSDNSAERWISDGLFVYSSAPAPSIVVPAQAPTPIPEARPSP